MVTVAYLVEKIIEKKPFLQEALSAGIVNNAALAEQMIPELEKALNKKVKFSTANMAIRRLAEKLEKSFVATVKFKDDSHINIRSNIVELTVYKTENIQEKIKKVYELVNYQEGDFLTLTQGFNELMLMIDEKYESQVLKIFSKKEIKKIIRNLSSISVNIPLESTETVGLFYVVTRALNWENINIIEIVSTLTEMTFIIDDDNTSKAYDVLKKLLNNKS